MSKIKLGFISNSSSSSFMILGVKVDAARPDVNKFVNDYYDSGELQKKFYCAYLDGRGHYAIGKLLADGEDQIDETSTTINELKKMADDIAKDLSKIGITDEIKLLTGTRPS